MIASKFKEILQGSTALWCILALLAGFSPNLRAADIDVTLIPGVELRLITKDPQPNQSIQWKCNWPSTGLASQMDGYCLFDPDANGPLPMRSVSKGASTYHTFSAAGKYSYTAGYQYTYMPPGLWCPKNNCLDPQTSVKTIQVGAISIEAGLYYRIGSFG